MHDVRALGGEVPEVQARALVRAVLRPRRHEQAKLGVGRLGRKDSHHLVVLGVGEAMRLPHFARDRGLTHDRLPTWFRKDSNIWRPPSSPRIRSDARSGCGISAMTFPASLLTPAMLSCDPLGFAAA